MNIDYGLLTKEIFGFDSIDMNPEWFRSRTYQSILEHRRNCTKWGKQFCLECFGGGLTIFTLNLRLELKKKWCKG
jgi:hypothetical protein